MKQISISPASFIKICIKLHEHSQSIDNSTHLTYSSYFLSHNSNYLYDYTASIKPTTAET